MTTYARTNPLTKYNITHTMGYMSNDELINHKLTTTSPYHNHIHTNICFIINTTTHNIISKHQSPKHLLLLQCGDIHPNLGPMPNFLQKHPATHKRRQTTYFLPSTIIFQPEYQHLAKTFEHFFQNTHHLHAQTIFLFPYLYNHIQQYINHPLHRSFTQ